MGRSKICAWSDEVLREECLPGDLLQFQCPGVAKDPVTEARSVSLRFGDHSRHPDPTDCRYFFLCLATGHPRRAGCAGGLVFSPVTGVCTAPQLVPGCENYYSGAVTDQDILQSGQSGQWTHLVC